MKDDGSKIEKRNTNHKPDEISYTEDIIKKIVFLYWIYKRGSLEVLHWKYKEGLIKIKKWILRREFEKADAITFFENFKDRRKNKEYESNLSDQS